MTAGASGSTWNDSQKDEIIRIAESAIETITQLSNVVGRSNPAPVPAPSNSCSSRTENAVDELHRRFPTAGSRFSRGSRSIRPAPYPSRRPVLLQCKRFLSRRADTFKEVMIVNI